MTVTTEQDPTAITARRFMDDLADEAIALAERKHLSISDSITIVSTVFQLLITMPADVHPDVTDLMEATPLDQ